MPKEKSASPLPAAASDFIVKMVLKNEEVLLRGQSHRLLSANDHRKELWRTIAKKVYEKYEVALSATQVQQHFNNRRKRALSVESEEKKYRAKTGGGRDEEAEALFDESRIDQRNSELRSYYNNKISRKGLPEADSLELNTAGEIESSPPEAEEMNYPTPENQQRKAESVTSLSSGSLTDCSIIVSNIDDVVEDCELDITPKRKNITNAELRQLQATTLKVSLNGRAWIL